MTFASITLSNSMFMHGRGSIKLIKQMAGKTIGEHRRKRKITLCYTDHGEHKIKARWIPTKVKVEEHVVVPNIDQNIENLDQFLEYYTTNKAISPMDKSKALWEFHLPWLRFHHSLADGMLVLEKHATQGITYFRSPKEKKCDARLLGITLFHTCVEIFKSKVIVCFPEDNETPLKGKPSATVSKFIHRIISFDDVKVVKNAMNIGLTIHIQSYVKMVYHQCDT
ncbi:LOW QUALITY PROTEIN: hypothetical protein HID58_076473 [Brassica napus]|uniref:Uncharacterized protein n=1 Tax=Brassica napus TaxID=3708 RepID=A0ABQ7YMM7_BRANA|nr:LOW QUALITY PROTEIN: hypothetical protein HID58_076473 [Brassica napus]